jgi:hypothetical protein
MESTQMVSGNLANKSKSASSGGGGGGPLDAVFDQITQKVREMNMPFFVLFLLVYVFSILLLL